MRKRAVPEPAVEVLISDLGRGADTRLQFALQYSEQQATGDNLLRGAAACPMARSS